MIDKILDGRILDCEKSMIRHTRNSTVVFGILQLPRTLDLDVNESGWFLLYNSYLSRTLYHWQHTFSTPRTLGYKYVFTSRHRFNLETMQDEPFGQYTVHTYFPGWLHASPNILVNEDGYTVRLPKNRVPLFVTRPGRWVDQYNNYYNRHERIAKFRPNVLGMWSECDWTVFEFRTHWELWFDDVFIIKSREPIDIVDRDAVIFEGLVTTPAQLLIRRFQLDLRPTIPLGILADYAADNSNLELYELTQLFLKKGALA